MEKRTKIQFPLEEERKLRSLERKACNSEHNFYSSRFVYWTRARFKKNLRRFEKEIEDFHFEMMNKAWDERIKKLRK